MSSKQNTVYTVRPGSTLKSILSPDMTDEPARDLAFLSLDDAEGYVAEMVDRAKLHKVYLSEAAAQCKEDEMHVLTGVVWDSSVCYLEFMDGHQRVLAEIDRTPLGA